jgi:hypothetical protein
MYYLLFGSTTQFSKATKNTTVSSSIYQRFQIEDYQYNHEVSEDTPITPLCQQQIKKAQAMSS